MKYLIQIRTAFLLFTFLFLSVSCEPEPEPDIDTIVISDGRFDFGDGIGCGNNLPGFGFRASVKVKKEYLDNLMIETKTEDNGQVTSSAPRPFIFFRNPPVRSDEVYNYYENVDLGFNQCQSNRHFFAGEIYSVRLFVPEVTTSNTVKETFPG